MIKNSEFRPSLNSAFLIGLCCLCTQLAFANSDGESKIPRREFPKVVPPGPPSATHPEMTNLEKPEGIDNRSFFGQIRYESVQYLTTLPETPHLTNSQLLSARLSGADHFESWDKLGYALDTTAGTYFTWRQSQLFVNEIYLKYDHTENFDASIGRRKFDWSELDTRWQLGLWQPKYTMDALRPEDQGLTGVFLSHHDENQEFVVLGAPVFIPTMGPDVREDSGSLVADSRWYRAPSKKWTFNNRVTPIYSSLDSPDIERLAKNPGVAALYRAGSRSEGARLIVSGAHKPVNDLILKRQAVHPIDVTEVKVSPDVTYHRLVSADLGYNWGAMNTSLSYMADEPQEKRPEEDWVIQKLHPLRAYSLNIDADLSSWFNRPVQVQTSYLQVHGGEIEDIGFDGAPDDINLFDERLKFSNAVMARVQGRLAFLNARPFMGKFSYIYDFDQKGSIWGTEFQYFPTHRWALVIGADLLGVENETDTDKRFINQFRANDRYYGGMSYVF